MTKKVERAALLLFLQPKPQLISNCDRHNHLLLSFRKRVRSSYFIKIESTRSTHFATKFPICFNGTTMHTNRMEIAFTSIK